jgi:hypothetical protein
VYFRRPRVYRDEKRVFHDVFDDQWNLSSVGAFASAIFIWTGPTNLKTTQKNSFNINISVMRSVVISASQSLSVANGRDVVEHCSTGSRWSASPD